MLAYFLENDLVHYVKTEITSWEEAIQESCSQLLKQEIINQQYVDEIIHSVKKYGPYIVIVPQVAMPHATGHSQGVFGTAIAFTKMKKPIQFDSVEGEKKEASLFFTLAAKDQKEHLENIQKLSDLLTVDGLIESLAQTQTIEDYQIVMNQYNL